MNVIEQQAETEAREAVLTGRASRTDGSFGRVLDAYAEAVRATERAKYQRLVAAVEGLLEHLEADDREGSIVDEHIRTLRAALADIEAQ